MSRLRRFLSLALLAIAVMLMAGSARAFDLNGAWAMDLSSCNKVFRKKGNQVRLTSTADLYGGGFIIEGNRARGMMVRCRIESRKEDGSTIHLNVACTTEVATEQVQFDLKVVNDNTVSKTFPETNIAMDYHRCKL